MTKKISQTEARKLKKRVAELESLERIRLNAWARDWPSGVHIDTLAVVPSTAAAVRTARKLKHAVVATIDDSNVMHLHALPLAEDRS